MCYDPLLIALHVMSNQYERQSICLTEAEIQLSTYFYYLRANLDNELCSALIIDRDSGCILSINLPAFELLAIDAVGLRWVDFITKREAAAQLQQQLQQIGEVHYTLLCHNADGCPMECKFDARTDSYCPQWAIARISTDQRSSYRRPNH